MLGLSGVRRTSQQYKVSPHFEVAISHKNKINGMLDVTRTPQTLLVVPRTLG